MYSKGNTVVDTKGYVVNIEKQRISVHIPSLNMDIKCCLYSKKIQDLIIVDATDKTVTVTHRGNGANIRLELGQKVELKFIVTFLEGVLKRKVVGQLVSPNPTAIFDFSIDPDDY